MVTTFKNTSLNTEIKTVLKDAKNIVSVTRGTISGASIEIEQREPSAFLSFTYYDDEKSRDDDFEILNELLTL